MKGLGIFILVVGILLVIYALNMDVTVYTGYGRVNNIGLMSDRQNFLIFGGILFIGGIMMMIFGINNSSSANTIKCPFCAEDIKSDAVKCKHCGSEIEKKEEVKKEDNGLRKEHILLSIIVLGLLLYVALN